MSYSIIARCARTGRLGIGAASYSIAIGVQCDGAIMPSTGVSFTQGFSNPRNNRLALSLLACGFGPRHALGELERNDPDFNFRQVAIVDRESAVATHSGARAPGLAMAQAGEGFAVLGSSLAGPEVVAAMSAAFMNDPSADLEDRLLASLEQGRDAGGLRGDKGSLPARSAALVVYSHREYNDLDIRVDLHDHAVDELRRIYSEDYRVSIAYYDERARKPHNATPAMEFADMLKRSKPAS